MLRLALTGFFLTAASAGTPDNVSSRLMIHIPHKLFKQEGYDHREALFGVPLYGGSIATNLFYADSDLCDQNVDTSKGFPIRPINNGKMDPWPSPFILMVDRGGCTFVKKVRNAQRAGAAGVIIADNSCLCSDLECIALSGANTQCENSEPIMADDGSGSDISIPSFLMFKVDADLIKTEVKANGPVQLEMVWALPSPDDRVEYDLWTVPSDQVSVDFLKNFKDIAVALGESAYFTPHMYVYDGIRSHCVGQSGENMCYNLCTNNGRYCATDPDNDLESGISGADVVKESLRRICIWKHYGEADGIGVQWWDYLAHFFEKCNTADFFMNDDCVKDAYKHSKVDGDAITRCMADSGGVTKDNPNAFLDSEIKIQTERGVVVLPTAFVNTAAIRGALTVNNIFEAICAGFAAGTTPKVCQNCAKCSDPASCVKAGGICKSSSGNRSSGGVSAYTFVVSMIFVIALFAGLGAWHYKRTREEMRDQVRGILAEYMPLEDQEDGTSPMDFARAGGKTSLIS